MEKVNTLGLVFTIRGSDPFRKPTLLAAHQDVVPEGNPSAWKHPPFAAYFDGEWLWGRGAADDKSSLTGLMSAMEALLSNSSWVPKRTVILAFGFDEECTGDRGAGQIGKFLTERYGDDSMAVLLDEGGSGMARLGDTLYALPAVIEKGHIDVWMELRVLGGHSSAPSPHTGVGIMSEIVTALEAHPYEAKVMKDSAVYNSLVCQARYSPDAWPELTQLLRDNDLDGLAAELVKDNVITQYNIQTSQAVDFIRGGQKINALPEVIRLGVNYRVAPQDSIPEVQHNILRHIGDVLQRYKLGVKAFEGDEDYENYVAAMASEDRIDAPYDVSYDGTLVLTAEDVFAVTSASPTSGKTWDVVSGTMQHTFAFENGTVVPVGQTMTGNTDTRHYRSKSRRDSRLLFSR